MAVMRHIKSVEAFQALPRAYRNLVFYSEGPEYWPHFEPIIEALLHEHRYPFVFLASRPDDPGLRIDSPLAKVFCIGASGERAELFRLLDADVMVMTMPDLETLYLKRSPKCRHYVYIFHSPVSTHMIYRPGAFDHYDSIFCVGPHHEVEIRQREAQTGAKPKQLFRHGYGRLDQILKSAPRAVSARSDGAADVLIAPSWGPSGIFETIGPELAETLLNAGLRVTARPHPQTTKRSPAKIKELADRFGDNDRFALETDVSAFDSLIRSDVMISDWSGAAFDYAFGLLKPVLFLNTPRKINNPDFEQLGIEPLEASLRERIGRLADPGALATLPSLVTAMVQEKERWRDDLIAERERWVFNVGSSGSVAAGRLVALASSLNLAGAASNADLNAAARQAAQILSEGLAGNGRPGAVVPFALELLETDAPYSSLQLTRLEALCRRIDVFKKVCAEYDSGFLKVIDKRAVAPEALAVLAHLLTLAAGQMPAEEFGRALKFLNAAGGALNLYIAERGAIGVPQLESRLFHAYKILGLTS